jgi:hypothetical protein
MKAIQTTEINLMLLNAAHDEAAFFKQQLSRILVYRYNSTQLNWTVSRHVLNISLIHVCKTHLNTTQLSWSF